MRPVAPFLTVVALLSVACRSTDKDDAGEIGLPLDTEDTGWECPGDFDCDGVSDEQDCAPEDAGISPVAVETCDGVDNNCDGEVDEGLTTTYYANLDADGFGDDATAVEACEASPGYRPLGGDCDDADYTVYPGAAERCDEVDNDCDGEVDEEVQDTWYADKDGDSFGDAGAPLDSCDPPDGYVAEATDCDDAAASTFPGAEELCNEVDDDCDGTADEDATDAPTWYTDADGDGFGDPDSAVEGCEQLLGTVADATDCDDLAVTTYPGADERCDEVDNDCDGDVDEDALDAPTWYVDVDGDGFGSDAFTVTQCDQPSGFEAADDDCDDADAAINPDATELCDEVDNDCDGAIDGTGTPDGDTFYADADSDGFGDPDSSVVSCEEPLGYTDDATDCDDTDDTVFPGSTETETPGDGVDQDCDGQDLCTDLDCDGIPDLFVGNYYSGAGYAADQQIFLGDGTDFDSTEDASLSGYGTWQTQVADVDGDGYQDLLAVNYYSGSSYYVNSYLYWGSATGYSSSNREDLQTYGAIRADIYDLDGDGYQDIAFAQYYPGAYSGYSYIYYGSSKGYSSGSFEYLPTLGAREVKAADFDGDGFGDLVFCNYYNGSSTNVDSYVYYGSVSGFSTANRTDLETHGCRSVDVEDVDGDGYTDILFANYYDSSTGYSTDSYVYYGAATGFSEANRAALATAGSMDAATGDFDGDGYRDIAFGSHYSGSSYSSSAYVYYGSSTGYSTANVDTVKSVGAYDLSAADLDSDGYDDLVIPTYYTGSSHSGSSYVHYGSASGFAGTPTSLDTVGASRVTIGDLDGDGHPELVFNNYYSGSWSTLTDTYVYWGSSGAYSESDRTDLSTYGSWPGVRMVGNTDW